MGRWRKLLPGQAVFATACFSGSGLPRICRREQSFAFLHQLPGKLGVVTRVECFHHVVGSVQSGFAGERGSQMAGQGGSEFGQLPPPLFRERGLSSLQPVGHFPYLLADAGPATVLVPGVQLLCGTGKNQGNGQTSR